MKIYQLMKLQKIWQIQVYNLKKFIQYAKEKIKRTKEKYTNENFTNDKLK